MSAGFFARQAAVALLYYLFAQAGMKMAVDGTFVTIVWPPSGIALVAILAYGYRMALGIAVGSFCLNLSVGLTPIVSVGIAIGNNLEYVGGAFLLRRLADFHLTLDRRKDVLALIFLSAFVSTSFSGLSGVPVLIWGGVESWSNWAWSMLKWWQGGMMGVLVVAPPLLVALSQPKLERSRPQKLEFAALLAAILLIWGTIFLVSARQEHGYYPAAFTVFPIIIWGALRFGLAGAAVVNLCNALLAILGTTHGLGPFVGASPVDSLVRWCLFTNMTATTGLFLAATSAEQQKAKQALKNSLDELERRVLARTAELAKINVDLQREMGERERLEAALIKVSDAQQKSIGRELHDGLGQHLISIAFFGAAIQQTLSERAQPEASATQRVVDMVNESIDMTRRIAKGLYPANLESQGLTAALEQLVDNVRMLNGMTCVLVADPALEVKDPVVAINLYRIAQEAVNNAVKHSRAQHVRIDLARIDEKYCLSVSDDGIGFEPELVEQGLGMHSLHARANILGGSLEIEKNIFGGTTVAVVCPTPS